MLLCGMSTFEYGEAKTVMAAMGGGLCRPIGGIVWHKEWSEVRLGGKKKGGGGDKLKISE